MCTYFSLLSDWTDALGLCLSQQAGFNNQNNASSALPLNADAHKHAYIRHSHTKTNNIPRPRLNNKLLSINRVLKIVFTVSRMCEIVYAASL